jgi:hypothetical protein
MDPIDFIVSHGSMDSNLKVEYFAFSVKVAIVSSISDRSVFKVWVRRNVDSTKLIKHVLETVNEFTKDRREHIESLNNEIKKVKDRITHVKQGWIRHSLQQMSS